MNYVPRLEYMTSQERGEYGHIGMRCDWPAEDEHEFCDLPQTCWFVYEGWPGSEVTDDAKPELLALGMCRRHANLMLLAERGVA